MLRGGAHPPSRGTTAREGSARRGRTFPALSSGESPIVRGHWPPRTSFDPRGQNSNTIAFRPRWNDDAIHRPGAIAITIATFDSFTGEIFDADMEMNDFEFDFSTNPHQP